jgi:arginyl-tRNA--protein-N-Asp/Glu arginylyltransferase
MRGSSELGLIVRSRAGMVAKHMTVYAYQELLDRGWRRSGTYLYRPFPEGCCCPAYTIRLNVDSFKPSKTQHAVRRRFENFVDGRWAAKQQIQGSAKETARLVRAATATSRRHQDAPPFENASATSTGSTNCVQKFTLSCNIACDDLTRVHNSLTMHCSRVVTVSLQQHACPAVAGVLDPSGILFHTSRKTNDLASPHTLPGSPLLSTTARQSSPSCTWHMRLQSSICWKAAAVSALRSCPADVPAMSKKQAKKARRRQRAPATTTQPARPAISQIASDLANSLVPTVQCALTSDPSLSLLNPSTCAQRGHLHVSLHVPQPLSAAPLALRSLLDSALAPSTYPPSPSCSDPPTKTDRTTQQISRSFYERHRASLEAGGMLSDDAEDFEYPSTSTEGSFITSSIEAGDALREASGHPRVTLFGVATDDEESGRHQWWRQPPPGGRWPFRMVMIPSKYVAEEFALYRKYQYAVHHEAAGSVTKGGFKRFLVDHPFGGIVGRDRDCNAPSCGYGAFHIQYWLGEHLIAVSVVDILPRRVTLSTGPVKDR